jgi:ferredoxin
VHLERRFSHTRCIARDSVIANYGYEDASGLYYITIDGSRCAQCSARGCLTACPQKVYAVETDDYDDLVAVVVEGARRRLRELCSPCKAQNGGGGAGRRVPCVAACEADALEHSW